MLFRLFGRFWIITAYLAIPCFFPGQAQAASPGCPAIDHFVQFQDSFFAQWKVSSVISASFSSDASVTGPSTFTYIVSGLERNVPSTGGVPGLITYCVYSSIAPDIINASGVGADGSLFMTLSESFGLFAYARIGADPGDIPFDGNAHSVGTSTFNVGFPAVQSILLQINDTAECNRLYGSTPDGSCFVLPNGTPPPAQSCIPDNVVTVDIADSCGVLQWLQPPWSQKFGDGTTLEVSCSLALNTGRLPAPAYMAWFTDSSGNRSRIAQCLFRDGFNDATYTVGHLSGNLAQSCLASVDWNNVDGGTNDGPRQATDFLGNPIIFTTTPEPYIDDVDYHFDASRKKLSWKDEKFPYPDATQVADQFAVGDILNEFVRPVADLTYSVDPLIGPELDNAFDTAWLEMQSDPGGPMKFIPGCDLNGDGFCDDSDQAMLAAAVGKCAGQAGYIARIDYDGDGCINANDAAVVQASFSAYRTGCVRSQGYWKNHPDKWPITSLSIGGNQYNEDELMSILMSGVNGNGAINLAHQLIAAKLNISSGASPVAASVASADALLNSAPGLVPPLGNASLRPSSVSGLVDTLERFNEGLIGPPECKE